MVEPAAVPPADARARLLAHLQLAPVTVAEAAAERMVDEPPEIPWHLAPEPGLIAMQLRTTVPRVTIGAGLARRAELVETIRRLDGVTAVVTSPAGGTFVVGGPAWLGLCAIGVPPSGQGMPLEWMLHSLHRWFAHALRPWGIEPSLGRVEHAWCPGFSDIAVQGKKLAGLGFRVTRDRVVMRGMLAVQAMPAADLDVLIRCHRLIGVEVHPRTAISLAEAAGLPALTVADAIDDLRAVSTH